MNYCRNYKDDIALYEGLKAKRNDAFECIYSQVYNSFENFVKTNQGTPDDAADAFQTGIMKFYANLMLEKYQLDYNAKIKTVVFDYCKKVWLTELNSARRRKNQAIDNTTPDYTDNSNTLNEMVKQDTFDLLRIGLERIGEDCKKLLTFFYIDNRSLKEIAQLLRVTDETAKSKRYICTKKLKSLIKYN